MRKFALCGCKIDPFTEEVLDAHPNCKIHRIKHQPPTCLDIITMIKEQEQSESGSIGAPALSRDT